MPQEIYPNAPIALAACEVRIPARGVPLGDEDVAAMRSAMDDVLPVVRTEARQQLTVSVNRGRPEPPSLTAEKILHITDRSQSRVVQISPESIVLKTADYKGWDDFRPLLGFVLRAVRDVLDPDGFVRLGLRYIDEIRLPEGGGSLADWDGYLHPALLSPAMLADADDALTARGWHTQTQLDAGDRHVVVVRYGPGDGYAVDLSESPRRLRLPEPGPYFMFDIDSFWEGGGEIPEFDPDALTSLADRLHRPVRALFDAAVTDRLRDDVLRKESA